ncbi:hypothetical protein AAVH_26734 [Aphelenchoides avenae]|nr:hypothetical protein AAVH_26734 [Aphelenchus avenae]
MAGDKYTTDEMVAPSTELAMVDHAGGKVETMRQKALENIRKPGGLDKYLQTAFESIERKAKNEQERQLTSTMGQIACISAAFVSDEALLGKYTMVAIQDPKADRPYKRSDDNGHSKEQFVSVGSGAVHAMQYLTDNTEKLKSLQVEGIDDFLREMYKHVADRVMSVSPSFSRVILTENGKVAEYARVDSLEEKKVPIYFDEEETPKKAHAGF